LVASFVTYNCLIKIKHSLSAEIFFFARSYFFGVYWWCELRLRLIKIETEGEAQKQPQSSCKKINVSGEKDAFRCLPLSSPYHYHLKGSNTNQQPHSVTVCVEIVLTPDVLPYTKWRECSSYILKKNPKRLQVVHRHGLKRFPPLWGNNF